MQKYNVGYRTNVYEHTNVIMQSLISIGG